MQPSSATAHTTTILRDIWVSSRISATYRMCKAFPLGRAFLLSLNIVVVIPPFHIYNPSKSPFDKGDLLLLPLSLRVIWASSRIYVTYRMCEAFPYGRAFFLSLNIVVVAMPHHLYLHSLQASLCQREVCSCCRYHRSGE